MSNKKSHSDEELDSAIKDLNIAKPIIGNMQSLSKQLVAIERLKANKPFNETGQSYPYEEIKIAIENAKKSGDSSFNL